VSRALPLRVLVRTTIAAAFVPPLLYLVSFARLARWLEGAKTTLLPPSAIPDFDDASLAGWLDRLLRRLPGPWRYTCLKRSAVLYHVLRRAGRPVELWIGVRRDGTQERGIGAHAWLVRDGVPYLESATEPSHLHTPIARFPGGERPTT
jgi:hypothetical protein